MSNIYNLFKFLEKKKETKTPFKFKLINAPEEITDEDLNVVEHLLLDGSSKITSLPNNLKIGGTLNVSYTSITSLPDNLKIGENLFINDTPLTSLPDNLQVGGNLMLNHLKISSIPNNLKVGRSLFLDNTPLAKKYDKGKIIKMILNKGGYFKGNLYGVD